MTEYRVLVKTPRDEEDCEVIRTESLLEALRERESHSSTIPRAKKIAVIHPEPRIEDFEEDI